MGSLVLATTQSLSSLLQVDLVFNMVKELITIEMERDSLQQKWGFTVQGGKDVSLTAKIASVKRFSPADRAGLEKNGLCLDREWKRGVQHDSATDHQGDCWKPTQDGSPGGKRNLHRAKL